MDRDVLKTDLRLRLDMVGADLTVREGDLETISDEDNLAQAIIHRLMTSRGELTELGHPDYGSRLDELIGEPNNERTRNRAKTLVLECLAQESRIKEIVSVNVNTNPLDPNRIDIEIVVVPIDSRRTLSITYPLRLEVA
ncbi:MAG: GPW/gp25 family protein [Candidatus Methanomethylicia archaeon]